MFQNYFNSQVDDFDELLFSYIASSGGNNRDAVGLTWDEFTDGFETFLDKGTNYQYYIQSLQRTCTCKPPSSENIGTIFANYLGPVCVPPQEETAGHVSNRACL